MTALKMLVLPLALLAAPLVADAQDWRDPRSLRRLERGGTEVFWDGNCRVEQRLGRNGELLERRSCRGDRSAYARAERNGEADAPAERDADEREAPRYADDPRPQREAPRYADDPPPRPSRESVYRAPPRDEPAPAAAPPEEPIPLAPHIVERPAPAMQAPRTLPRPPAPAAPVVAKVAPKAAVVPVAPHVAAKVVPAAPVAANIASKAAIVAAAPHGAAKAAPVPSRTVRPAPAPSRIAARAAPAPVRLVTKAAPVHAVPTRRQVVRATPVAPAAKARPMRMVAKLAPAPVRQLPPARPNPVPRLLAKAAPPPAPARAAARPLPPRVAVHAAPAPVAVQRKPAPVLAQAAPRAVMPAPPAAVAKPAAPVMAEAPHANPAPETAVRKSGSSKSEWLVVLQPEAAAAAAAAKPHADAKAEHALSQQEYEAYIAKKRREPYSNL